jgi:prevent-host-death family protein
MMEKPGKPLRVAEFKSHLSAYLKRVRKGGTLTIFDRDTPIARVVPVDDRPGPLPARPAAGRLRDLDLPRRPVAPGFSSLEVLAELRRDRL